MFYGHAYYTTLINCSIYYIVELIPIDYLKAEQIFKLI